MAKGKVKWFSQAIGAGFIRTDEGQDVFFRLSTGHNGNMQYFQRGQDVYFEIRKNPRSISLTAANVQTCELAR